MISALFLLASVVSTASASADVVPTYGGEIVYQGEFPDLIVNPTDFGKADHAGLMQAYQATDKNCSAINTCRNCDPSGECYVVEKYPKITISEYGRVVGDEHIQREIMNRGPVACYLNSDCIHNYTGGVSPYNESYTGEACKPYLFNHAIQLNGWGVTEEGQEYWIGRNSWGTYWGEDGFFNIVKGGAYNPIGCYWAVPD
eukprot:gene28783-35704_t